MTRLGDQARIRRSGSHVDHLSPIEDQAVEVYQAARKLAAARGFRKHVHNGPFGAVSGLAGPMVLTQLVRQLFPGYGEEEFRTAYSIINQALRKTDSLVCLKRPVGDPQHRDPKDMPVWFVRDEMPGNLVVVTLAQAKKSADVTERPTQFDETKFLTPRERRLSKEAAGETLPAGEVTVTHAEQPKTPAQLREDALAARREEAHQEHERFKARVLEEIQTSPVPLTTGELRDVLNASDGFTFHRTTYRDVVRKLVADGKVVGRKETDDERLLRGGGSMPKGGRSSLWAASPGPVPVRTKLPDGVNPHRSALEWDEEKRQQRETDMQAILDFIGREHRDKRRRTRMIDTLGLTDERFNAATRELETAGKIYTNQGRYYLARRSTKSVTPEKVNPLPSATDPVTVPSMPSPASPVSDGDEGDLALVQRLAEKLGVTLPQGDEQRVRDLEAENAKLKEQVSALKAAIAALA